LSIFPTNPFSSKILQISSTPIILYITDHICHVLRLSKSRNPLKCNIIGCIIYRIIQSWDLLNFMYLLFSHIVSIFLSRWNFCSIWHCIIYCLIESSWHFWTTYRWICNIIFITVYIVYWIFIVVPTVSSSSFGWCIIVSFFMLIYYKTSICYIVLNNLGYLTLLYDNCLISSVFFKIDGWIRIF
jgi:hypothetical protein